MTTTIVHQIGNDAFSSSENEGVFTLRQNPMSATSRVFCGLFGLAFLAFGVCTFIFSSSFQNDPPLELVYGAAALFSLLGLFIIKLAIPKAQKLRFVEIDAEKRSILHGHFLVGSKEEYGLDEAKITDGEIPISSITKIRLSTSSDSNSDNMEIRARDGKLERGFARLLLYFENGRLRRDELVVGDYYAMKEVYDRIQLLRG